MSCLAHVFEEEGALDRLEAFSSLNGPRFYGLPPNAGTLTLYKGETAVWPAKILTEAGPIAGDAGRAAMGYRILDRERAAVFPRTFRSVEVQSTKD